MTDRHLLLDEDDIGEGRGEDFRSKSELFANFRDAAERQ